jgi:hypothetical protein
VTSAWRKFEEEICAYFRRAGFKDARVSCQSRGAVGQPDVDAHPFHVECKHYTSSKLNVKETLQRAKRETKRCDKYTIVVHYDSDGDTTVTMDFKDFMNLIQEYITKV